jgi:hypothetical protein
MRKLQIEDAEVMRIAIQQEIWRSEESRYDHRLHGLLLVTAGHSCREVAELFGENGTTVQRGVSRFEQDGLDALREGAGAGRPRTLDAKDWRRLQGICVKPRETSTWPPLCGRVRSCPNICVADMEWTLEFDNVSGYFDNWVFGYTSRVLKSLRWIR